MSAKIAKRVAALLSKAESTTPEEAELLLEKATELMRRHAIDEAMLAAVQGRVVDVIEERKFSYAGAYCRSHRDFTLAIGRGLGFRRLQGGYDKTCDVYWIGWRSELDAGEQLLASLFIQATRGMWEDSRRWNAEQPWASGNQRSNHRHSFLRGFAAQVSTRLTDTRKRVDREVAREQADEQAAATIDENVARVPSVALVLMARDEQVTDWYDKRYGKLKAGRARYLSSPQTGYGAGRAAGERADLGQPRVHGSRGELGK